MGRANIRIAVIAVVALVILVVFIVAPHTHLGIGKSRLREIAREHSEQQRRGKVQGNSSSEVDPIEDTDPVGNLKDDPIESQEIYELEQKQNKAARRILILEGNVTEVKAKMAMLKAGRNDIKDIEQEVDRITKSTLGKIDEMKIDVFDGLKKFKNKTVAYLDKVKDEIENSKPIYVIKWHDDGIKMSEKIA
eukprot:gene19070-6390_t